MTTKSLIHKLARFNKEVKGKTLQDLVTTALKQKKAATSRQKPGDSPHQFSLVNYNGPFKGLRVGEFFDYTQGHRQPVAKFNDRDEELTITSVTPSDKNSDFLHSILYFGIWKNSVIMSQSMTLRSSDFEAYLNWLLSETGLLGEGDFISLIDYIPPSMHRKIKSTRGIEFVAPVTFEPKNPNGVTEKTRSIAYKPKNLGWDVLKQIFPDELKLPSEYKESDIIPNSELEVTLLLKWTTTRKDDPTSLLDQISNQLRHVDTELDYKIHTKSGTITKDQIKLKTMTAVSTDSNGLVKKSDMWERIQAWLQLLSDEGRIPQEA